MKLTYLLAIIGLAGTALAVSAPEPAVNVMGRDLETEAKEASTHDEDGGGPGWGGGGRGGGWGGGGHGGGWGGGHGGGGRGGGGW